MWEILLKYHEGFANGLLVTLELTCIAWAAGLFLGTLVGWLAHHFAGTAGRALAVLSFLGSGIPVIVLLFWAHYPLQVLLRVVIHPFITAACVLTLVNVLAIAQIVKSALNQFPEEFITAAKVCGLPRWITFRRVRLPILFRQITPSLLSSQVVILQTTLFASMISVEEILRVSQRINATAYKPVEIYSALALLFLAVCLPLNGAAMLLKRRFDRNLSER